MSSNSSLSVHYLISHKIIRCSLSGDISLTPAVVLLSVISAFMVLPFAYRQCNVDVFLVPWEEMFERHGAIGLGRSGEEVELSTAWTHQCVGTAQVDKQPLLQKTGSVVRQEGALLDELYPSLHVELWLTRRQTTARQFSFDN